MNLMHDAKDVGVILFLNIRDTYIIWIMAGTLNHILVISSLLNAVYFFRILEQMFVQHEASLTEINRHEGKLGLPPEMAIPILCAGIGILVLGFYSVDIVDDILKSGLPEVFLR